MRKFYAGNGTDSTAAVAAYLATNKQYYLADLYLIGDQTNANSYFLTNWQSPLVYTVRSKYSANGLFSPSVIKRGNITSQFGLKVENLQITWSPPLTRFGSSAATENPYQKAQNGRFDNLTVRVLRTIMPTPGDCNTLGATTIYGGWVQDIELGRGYITLDILSFLSVLNQKVPANVIESSNALASYVGAQPVYAESQTAVAFFTVVAPSGNTVILGQCTAPVANHVYNEGVFILGYMVFTSGNNLGYVSPIALNVSILQGITHYNQFTVYQAFPYPPSPGDTFYVSTQLALDLASAPSDLFAGFPYVPDPTGGL